MMSRPQRRWTAEEDSNLQREVESQMAANNGSVHDWNSVALRIDGRSNKDCRKRFYNGMADALRKGPWTSEEDQMLVRLINKHGTAWAVVAPEMGTRSDAECSKRWQHCLNPELNRSPWTAQENMQLLIAVRTHGSSWKDIQTLHLPSRSANNVKNQFSVLKRQTLEILPDAPSCCASRTSSKAESSQSATDVTGVFEAGADFLDQYVNDDNSNQDISHQRTDDPDPNYPFPHFPDNQPFPAFERDILPNNLDTNLFYHDFLLENLDFGPSIKPSHDYNLGDYDIQMDDATIGQPSRINCTEPLLAGNADPIANNHDGDKNDNHLSLAARATAQQRHHHRPSGAHWPTSSLERIPLPNYSTSQQGQQQQEIPALTSTPSSDAPANPSTPSWQTTIRFSGADPSTVSTVIGVLAKSQAKFVYETH
ncbi:MAG: hypothetical protein L6R36_007995 [Xanthoria steineri]|nr:MAG: hypothetical protein L6R36_007995 [Xanthoria steineri]